VTTIVVPFREGGKSRLPPEIRREAALAMLGDVLDAAVRAGETRIVTDDLAACLVAADLGVETVPDPGGGQGPAVAAALRGLDGPVIVVNADVPCVRPSDLNALAVPPRSGAVSLVEAPDGTTNALGLPFAEVFVPLFGRGSAAQFRAHARALGLVCHDIGLRNLQDDVDTVEALERIGPRAGPRTRTLLAMLLA